MGKLPEIPFYGNLHGVVCERKKIWTTLAPGLLTGIIVGYSVTVRSAIDERGRSDRTIRGVGPFCAA
jgi:hypothetical protein